MLDLTKCVSSKSGFYFADGARRDWGFDDVPKTEIGRFYLTQNPVK